MLYYGVIYKIKLTKNYEFTKWERDLILQNKTCMLIKCFIEINLSASKSVEEGLPININWLTGTAP